ncbi:resolvase (plasmid) [Escherichia coli]|nr:recombinase family protein [Escherichia coli]AWR85011.1 resolvase [Escherichia coli]
MHGQRIGYVRVSSFDQNPERQLEQIQVDKVFTDKASGKDTRRPELERLLAFVREGDTVVVHSMDRLARNLDDLRRLVQGLTQRGVRIEFLKEHLTFTGEDSPMANLMLSVMGAFAEFERALIRERQREGIALAKQRGAYRGRKKSLSSERIAELRQRVEAGEQKTKGTVAKLAMRQPFVLFKGLTFQKLCLPGAFRPGDHHNKMLRPGLCVVHASPQYL